MYRRIVPLILILLLAGCAAATPQPEPQTPVSETNTDPAAEVPTADLSSFVEQINNPYFPLSPGVGYAYTGTIDGAEHRLEIAVTNETRTVNNVKCIVVRETLTANGSPIEDARNCYAQDIIGNVWKFAEEGVWEAGVDGAEAGMVMPAFPEVGDSYQQGNAAGKDEDVAEVLSITEAFTLPFSPFENVVKIKVSSPLEPGHVEHRYYAAGIGLVMMIMAEGGEGQIEISEFLIAPPTP